MLTSNVGLSPCRYREIMAEGGDSVMGWLGDLFLLSVLVFLCISKPC